MKGQRRPAPETEPKADYLWQEGEIDFPAASEAPPPQPQEPAPLAEEPDVVADQHDGAARESGDADSRAATTISPEPQHTLPALPIEPPEERALLPRRRVAPSAPAASPTPGPDLRDYRLPWSATALMDIILHPTVLHVTAVLLVIVALVTYLLVFQTPMEREFLLYALTRPPRPLFLLVITIALAFLGYRWSGRQILGHSSVLNVAHIALLVFAVGALLGFNAVAATSWTSSAALICVVLVAASLTFLSRSLKLIGVWRRPGHLRRRRYAAFVLITIAPIVALAGYRKVLFDRYLPHSRSLESKLTAEVWQTCDARRDECTGFFEQVGALAADASHLYFGAHLQRSEYSKRYAALLAEWLRSFPRAIPVKRCDGDGSGDDAATKLLSTAALQANVIEILNPNTQELADLLNMLSTDEFDPRSPFTAAWARLIDSATGSRLNVRDATAESVINRLSTDFIKRGDSALSLNDPAAYAVGNQFSLGPTCTHNTVRSDTDRFDPCPLPVIAPSRRAETIRSIGCVFRADIVTRDTKTVEYYVSFVDEKHRDQLANSLITQWHAEAVGSAKWQVPDTNPAILFSEYNSKMPLFEKVPYSLRFWRQGPG